MSQTKPSTRKRKQDPEQSNWQRKRVGRYVQIIQRLYRKHRTESQVASDLEISIHIVKYAIRALKNAYAGRWTNARSVRGKNRRGRPRKKNVRKNC